MIQAPLQRTWWVQDELLLAGGFPGDYHDAGTEYKLRKLLQAGVRCFISLQQKNEMSRSVPFTLYAPVAEKLAQEMGIKIKCLNFPILDMGIPDKTLMREILDAIEKSIDEKQCVYLHCWGGHGRTGTVVGCWLRQHDFSGVDALQHIKKLRSYDPGLLQWESPQNTAQKDMILYWEPYGT